MSDLRNVYELILENLLLEAPITLKAILSKKQPKLYNAAKKAYEKLMLSNMTEDPEQLKLIEDPQAEADGLLNPDLLAFKRKVFEISPTGEVFDFIFKMIARDDFESNADNIRQLTQLVDMGVRSVSFKKNIMFLNELIQKMLMKQDQINQKDKSQTFYKKFDPSMSIFSKIENYYDLYENLKKYYESGNDNLISAFIKIKTSDNLKEFLLASDMESAEISPVGVFSEIRNKNLMPNAKEFSEKAKETNALTGRSFAGYYVPFINYCLDNKIWTELITEKRHKNIKLFLIKNYNAMVCANNFYPKDFLKTCTDDVVKSITGTTKSKTQHSSGVSDDYLPIGGNQAEIMGLMDSTANWCVKASEYYSQYVTADVGINFLLILDNTCKKVYLMRLQSNDDQTKAFDKPMDYYDKETKPESFSPELRTIWTDMFGSGSDDEAKRLFERITGSLEGKLTNQGYGTITVLNEIPVEFYFDDQLKINHEQKNLQIFNEVFVNNSNKIKKDLKNLENINITSIFEYILDFINKNVLDNDNIRLFGILLKNDELGVNINVFNLMSFIAMDNESNTFFKKLIFDTLIDNGLNQDLEIIKLMINERNIIQILNLIKKTQNIFNDRMKIELTQSLNNENLLKIIDELYFSGFFKNDINTIKKYFEINTAEKINSFKNNISDQIFKTLLTESENFKPENILTEMLGNIRLVSSDNPLEFYNQEIQQEFKNLMPDIFFEILNNQIAINHDPLITIATDEFLTNLEKDLSIIKTDASLQNIEKDLNQFTLFLDNILKLRQQLETDYGPNIEKAAQNYDRYVMYSDRAADYGNYKIEGTDLFGIDKAYVGFYKNTSANNKINDSIINCFKKLKEQKPLMNNKNIQIKMKNLIVLKNCYKFSEKLRTDSKNLNKNIINGKKLGYLKTYITRALDYNINNLENLNNIINIVQKFKNSIEMYNYDFIYTTDFSNFKQIIAMNKNNNDNYYTRLFDLIFRVLEELSRLKYLNEFDAASFNEILKGDHYEDKIENPNIRTSMTRVITNFEKNMLQANEREALKKQQEDDKNKPGFFQRMMKKWFLEGVQYQRINQNKILISENELKKLIRKRILQ